MKERFSYIGKRLPAHDIKEKVTGTVQYTDDIKLHGMLFGKILRSPHPHARIERIDTSNAEGLLGGGKYVVTASDAPATLVGGPLRDMPLFAKDKVRYIGEPVAAVAARSPELAIQALTNIKVEYQTLPAIFDPVEAMDEKAALIHEHLGDYRGSKDVIRFGNVCSHTSIRRGDVEKAFREADHLFEDVFHTQGIIQGQIEPHATIALARPAGRIEVWTHTTAAFRLRQQLSEIFGLPLNAILVNPMSIGGSFGSKNFVRIEPYCVILSKKSGQPVKMVSSREEEFTSFNPRHASTIEIKTGVRKDGSITARKVRLTYDTGAYSDYGPLVTGEGAKQGAGPYNIPNVEVDSYCVYTNKMSSACCRSHGTPQPTFAFESQMDIIAARLGMDPLELRLKNAVEEAYAGPGGDLYLGVGIKETLLKVSEKIDLKNRDGVNRGKGIAVGNWYSGGGASSALMKLNEDGTVSLSIGAPDVTGTDIMAAQVAAEELGVPLDRIVMTSKSTDHSPFDLISAGSRITHCVGQAVKTAAADFKVKLLEATAPLLDTDRESLEIDGGAIRVRHAPEKQIALRQLAMSSHFFTHGPIIGSGTYFGKRSRIDREALRGHFGDMGEDRTFVAQGAEVEVDIQTGNIRVVKLVSANDIGFALNPSNVENQVFGGVYQGLGYALREEIKMEAGKVMNPNFRDYGMLRAPEMPEVECHFIEKSNGPGPYGAKGLGEQPNVPTAAAIANAVYDAIGVRIRSLPITPEKILSALREKGE